MIVSSGTDPLAVFATVYCPHGGTEAWSNECWVSCLARSRATALAQQVVEEGADKRAASAVIVLHPVCGLTLLDGGRYYPGPKRLQSLLSLVVREQVAGGNRKRSLLSVLAGINDAAFFDNEGRGVEPEWVKGGDRA